jgi:hypothetical protein
VLATEMAHTAGRWSGGSYHLPSVLSNTALCYKIMFLGRKQVHLFWNDSVNWSNNCTSKVRLFLCPSPVLARHIGGQKVRIHTFITLSLDQEERSASLHTLVPHLKYPVWILFLPGIQFWPPFHRQ